MGLFITSVAQATRPGVFALETAPPRFIQGVSLGFIGLVAAFAWGPDNVVVTPESPGAFLDTFEPAGSPRSSTGYYATMGRRKAPWKIVRALATNAVAASLTRAGTGGDVVATAKYKGVLGNSISVQQADAASGLANAKDFTVTLTDAVTGTTQEVYRDVPLPTGTDVEVDVSESKLLASLVADGAMTVWPANATASLTSGSNGTALGTTDYTGTAGATDRGCALFEAHGDVRVVCHDDCGNTNRAAINAAFAAHAAFMGDRLALLDGNSDAASWAAVKAYIVNAVISDRVRFFGAWVSVYDDAGVARTTPMSTFAATAIVNQLPMQSDAQWADETTDYYQAIVAVVATFATASETVQSEATSLGVALPIKLESGRYAILHDRTTSQTSGRRYAIRRRIADYLAKALKAALPAFINAPNVVERHRQIKTLIDVFLAEQVRLGIIVAFSTDITTPNTPSTLAQGQFYVGIDAQSPAPMEKIILLANVGEGVTVREAA